MLAAKNRNIGVLQYNDTSKWKKLFILRTHLISACTSETGTHFMFKDQYFNRRYVSYENAFYMLKFSFD
jgi:hypothetical protein